MFPPHQRGQSFAGDHLKSALGFLCLDHTVERQRSRYPFEFCPPAVFTFEEAFDQTIGRRADDDLIGCGLSLDAGRDIGCLAQG
jgi:hypothetical protein